MPKVTRKTARPARPPARSPGRPRRRAPLQETFERYGAAGLAGALVLTAAAAMVFWAGGYVGVVLDRADGAVRAAAVASGFEVRRVTVAGRRDAARDDILGALGPSIGQSILHVDLEAARRRIEALGWVRAAAVSRLLPDTIQVSIREREPAAIWQMSGTMRLIDQSGAVIRDVGGQEYPGLPLVVGAGAPQSASGILTALKDHPEIAAMTAAITRYGDRRWNLRLKNGLDVMLPEGDVAAALATLAGLEDAHQVLDRPLEHLDLRDPDRLVARPRGAAAAGTVN